MVKDEIVFAILAKDKEYCLDYFLQCLYNQTYDKKKIHLYIRTNDNKDNTKQILLDYIKHNGMLYGSVFYNDMSVDPKLKLEENDGWNSFRFKILGKIRQESVDYAKNNGLHYFVADIDNFIRPNTLENMIKYKEKNVIAPMLKSTTCYSNFHYECDKNGYLKNNPKYYDYYFYKVKGLTPVDVVHCTYFVNNSVLDKVCYDDDSFRYEYVIFSDSLRKNNIKQYLANDCDYGLISLARDRKGIKKHVLDILEKNSLTSFFIM